MKYRLVNPELNSPYLENLLKERGVEDVKEYIKPTQNYLNDPAKLDNIEKGAELYLDVVKRNGNILIVVDSDCDGFTSATIIYQYTKKIAPEIRISYLLHEGKQHGLQDHIDTIFEKGDNYDLIILPDSSSNDYKYHEQLKNICVPALVLDHHLTDVEISNNAVVINNQLSKNYPNKELTGAGVTYQFCRYIDNLLKVNYADYFIDLAAWGIN